MSKPARFRSVSLDHVAAVAGGAFAFDEAAAGFEPRRRPTHERRIALGALGSVVVLAGWLFRRLAA